MTLITDYTFTPCRCNKLEVEAAITYFNMFIFHHLVVNCSFENMKSNTHTNFPLWHFQMYRERNNPIPVTVCEIAF